MKVGKSVLVVVNIILCFSFGFFVLIFNQTGKPYMRGFYCDDDSINKPFKESTVSSTNAVIVSFVLAVVCFLLGDVFSFIIPGCYDEGKSFMTMFRRTRKGILRNFVVVALIYTYGMGFTMFITDIGKYSIGRLRPHFYDVCKPDWSKLICITNGTKNYFVGNGFCSQTSENWHSKNARLSFPSGHSSFAAYCATFIILYMDRFMPVSNPLLCLPKMFVQIGIASLAIYCGLSRISDYKHHPTDVLAGLILGVIVGFLVFFCVLIRSCMPLLKVKETSMETLPSGKIGDESQQASTNNISVVGQV